jgi:hypothetical protein
MDEAIEGLFIGQAIVDERDDGEVGSGGHRDDFANLVLVCLAT